VLEFVAIYEGSFTSQEKEIPCGESDQVSDRESEPPDRRESGGWLFVIALVEAALQGSKLPGECF